MYPSLLLLLLVIGLGAARGFGVGLAPNCGAGVVAQHGQHVVGGFSANRVGRDTDAVSVMMSASQFNRDGGANEHMDKRDDQREDDPVVSIAHGNVWVVISLTFLVVRVNSLNGRYLGTSCLG